jgi:hypothetical protein
MEGEQHYLWTPNARMKVQFLVPKVYATARISAETLQEGNMERSKGVWIPKRRRLMMTADLRFEKQPCNTDPIPKQLFRWRSRRRPTLAASGGTGPDQIEDRNRIKVIINTR